MTNIRIKRWKRSSLGTRGHELKMLPTLLNTSDPGISLKTLRVLEISEFDRARIFESFEISRRKHHEGK